MTTSHARSWVRLREPHTRRNRSSPSSLANRRTQSFGVEQVARVGCLHLVDHRFKERQEIVALGWHRHVSGLAEDVDAVGVVANRLQDAERVGRRAEVRASQSQWNGQQRGEVEGERGGNSTFKSEASVRRGKEVDEKGAVFRRQHVRLRFGPGEARRRCRSACAGPAASGRPARRVPASPVHSPSRFLFARRAWPRLVLHLSVPDEVARSADDAISAGIVAGRLAHPSKKSRVSRGMRTACCRGRNARSHSMSHAQSRQSNTGGISGPLVEEFAVSCRPR